MNTTDTTEEKIKQAAQKVFLKKGLAGARMQEIADEAGINKAMLHYYFRSKDKLFREIFESSIKILMGEIGSIIKSDLVLFDKIKKIIDVYIDLLLDNPSLPIFILSEINQNPEFMERMITSNLLEGFRKVFNEVEGEIARGNIHPIDPIQLWINVISMVIFPFAARPLLQRVVENGMRADFDDIVRHRKEAIYEFTVRALKKQTTR